MYKYCMQSINPCNNHECINIPWKNIWASDSNQKRFDENSFKMFKSATRNAQLIQIYQSRKNLQQLINVIATNKAARANALLHKTF